MNRETKRAVDKGMKSKKARPIKLAKTEEPVEIPEDLKNQWGAVRATAVTFECLKYGHFTHANMSAVENSLQFVKNLYDQSLEVALKHPQANLIPELDTELKVRKAQSGKAPKDNN